MDANSCAVIAWYCAEDRLDHNDCDKVFDDIGCPRTPIARLFPAVASHEDETPSAMDIHLCEGLFGAGQTFGEDVCYGAIRVFSPTQMKLFASRMVRRLLRGGDEDVRRAIFGADGDAKDDNCKAAAPAAKRRKLSASRAKGVEAEEVFDDEVLFRAAYWLSASGIFAEKRQGVVWDKVFLLPEDQAPWGSYEGNHSLCALAFGLNAAAMGRGVIAHYW